MVLGKGGLTGLGTLEVRTIPEIAAVGIHLGAEAILVGRAVGHEVEPIYGIDTQRYVDAYAGRGLPELLADIAAVARARGGGQPSLLPARARAWPRRDRSTGQRPSPR